MESGAERPCWVEEVPCLVDREEVGAVRLRLIGGKVGWAWHQ